MKLEPKHITPYILFNLQGIVAKRKVEITGIDLKNSLPFHWKGIDSNFKGICSLCQDKNYEGGFTPILHPLSDLTKEIKHNGERFVPIKDITLNIDEYRDDPEKEYPNSEGYFFRLNNVWYKIDQLSYWRIQQLFEWHFDVFGLIDEDLAIDINTLES